MRHFLTASACVVSSLVIVAEQGPSGDSKLFSQLKGAFPAATSFSAKEGSPPHFKAYVSDPQGKQTLAGFAFWTTELEPLERGYDGPIKMIVGLDVTGVVTGVVVVEHREPYGSFSVEPPEFAAQFRNKRIRDPFKVGGDIDAVSRATITITSATRAIRNSSRRMARQYLSPEAVK
jgi:transcriptional regulator of nitric oxide reductase